jgi:hypothetical protein
MTGELKKYDVSTRLTMPGNVKETEYHINISANTPAEAAAKFQEEWAKATTPNDVRAKEIAAVITAS